MKKYFEEFDNFINDERDRIISAATKFFEIDMDIFQRAAVLDAYMKNVPFQFDSKVKNCHHVAVSSCLDNHQLLKKWLFVDNEDYKCLEDYTTADSFRNYNHLERIYGICLVDAWNKNIKELLDTKQIRIHGVIRFEEAAYEYLVNHGMNKIRAAIYYKKIKNGGGRHFRESEINELEHHGVPEWYIEECRRMKHLVSMKALDSVCWAVWRLLCINYMDNEELYNYIHD